ncbi:MAG: hypothetical protein GX825_05935 [Syntrophomonadaceae bacterium]|nr:hypothetical protein [Syntrophomonadaceae bacterium]
MGRKFESSSGHPIDIAFRSVRTSFHIINTDTEIYIVDDEVPFGDADPIGELPKTGGAAVYSLWLDWECSSPGWD